MEEGRNVREEALAGNRHFQIFVGGMYYADPVKMKKTQGTGEDRMFHVSGRAGGAEP